MKNHNLAEKLKDLRVKKGLSQEQLSEISKLSIRTIQRIENGKNIPTGDTLNKIASALDASIEGLVINEMKDDKGILSLITLSAISYILHPLLGILLPAILWYFKRNSILNADEVGRKLISFQITWQLAFFIYLVLALDSSAYLWYYNYNIAKWIEALGGFELQPIACSIYFFNLAMILINLLLIQFGKKPGYLLSIPFMGWSK
jgi:transcriptional regulator with XRE-family HTH domain